MNNIIFRIETKQKRNPEEQRVALMKINESELPRQKASAFNFWNNVLS